jgi:hypothetical protein
MIIKMIEILSYWFFLWFLLYIIGIIKQNPLWFLIIGYLITIIEFIYLIYKKTNKYNLIKFFIINIIIKFIPIIIILIKTSFNFIITTYDIKFGISLIMIYIIIMNAFNINVIKQYNKLLNTYIKNDNNYKSFISKLYDDIYNFWTSFCNSL